MDVFRFDHLDRCQTAHYALYTPVRNAADIRQRIIAAATADGADGDRQRDDYNFAFIDATLITSTLHLQTAVYQAVIAELEASLRTKTVHSEILFALNPSNNITEAIRRYGISNETTSLLVVHVRDQSTPASEIEARLERVVDGTMVPFSSLEGLTDWPRIQKYHKLNNEPGFLSLKADPPKQKAFVDSVAVSSVAAKSVLS